MLKLNLRETGTCPVCEGECSVTAIRSIWNSNTRGYVETATNVPCTNCGGQYMFGTPSGMSPLNKEGVPCKHSYTRPDVGYRSSTYSVTRCEHCNDKLTVDSGD